MFVGEYTCKLDSKGRVLFPSTLIRQLNADARMRFVLKRDIYVQCLLLYPASEWERQTSILTKRLNPFNRSHAEFLREFYRGTAEVVLDANNRMLIPKRLIECLGAEVKDLVFAGQDGKVEIWSASSYERSKASENDFANMAEELLGGDLLLNGD